MNLNHEQNDSSANEDDLRQLLMELHYGLLEDDEAESLRERIDSEPPVAKLWAETLSAVEKIALAARIDSSSVQIPKQATQTRTLPSQPAPGANSQPAKQVTGGVTPPPVEPRGADHQAAPRSGPEGPSGTGSRSRYFRWWLGSLATAASLAIVLCGIRQLNDLPETPRSSVRVAIAKVDGVEATTLNEFQVTTTESTPPAPSQRESGFDARQSFVPANISFQVLSKGVVLFLGSADTSDEGVCRISVPDDVVIPNDSILKIQAKPAEGNGNAVALSIPIEPTRCLTHLATDKPVYRPGESIFFRSVTLNRRSLESHLDVPIRFKLVDSSGTTVTGATLEGITERGVGNGTFLLPDDAAGGTYQLVAESLDGFFPDQTLDLEVRRYRAARLKTDLDFTERSYGGGDEVHAELTVRRADDEIPSGARAMVIATVDGAAIFQEATSLDLDGKLVVRFNLPRDIREGVGQLTIAIDDGNVRETASRPIPIHTGRAEVDFYPEGGYLVSGVHNRVYFTAHDTHDRPIDITGEVLSQAGRVVANVQTLRDGMGRFEFTPEPGQRYSLRITSPIDITETPWLPSVVGALPVMDTGTGVFDADEPIQLTIRSKRRRKTVVRAVCRGELVGNTQPIDLSLGETRVSVPIRKGVSGVIRVTVLDLEASLPTPLVERLVYRRGNRVLNVAATVDSDKRIHSPGDSVRMTVRVTDETGELVPGAVLGVNVVDDSALSLRQQDLPSLRTHFLVTSEVESPEDLEHADFYLGDTEEAEAGLDLLLGTQGWRRFVSGDPEQADESVREKLVRLLELDGVPPRAEPEVQSNDPVLAQRYRDYQISLSAAWREFVVEVRFVLVVIGALWVVGLIFRPRKELATAAGLLLIATITVVQGCGGVDQSYVVGEGAEFEDQSMADASGAVAMEEPIGNVAPAAGEFMEVGDAAAMGASAPKNAPEDPADTPFLQRFAQSFFKRQGVRGDEPSDPATLSPGQLAAWASARGMDSQSLADQMMAELRFPIRQYAHLHRPTSDGVRSDFAETVYWNPLMVTDSTGTASIRFDLSDSLTLFHVSVDAHAPGGRLGSGTGSVVTRLPLQVEPKLPLEVTGGDRIDLPLGIVNASGHSGNIDIELETDAVLTAKKTKASLSLQNDARHAEMFSLDVSDNSAATVASVRVSAEILGSDISDQVERSLRVVPRGFPFTASRSGSASGHFEVPLNLPDSAIPSTVRGTVRIFPSTHSQLSAGLESILREPHGCFEQASASNYPNVMAFQLLQLDGATNGSMVRRTESLLRRGYRKLTSYECSELGYEWFGNDPGHEALSAFGLMQFSEMSKVVDVDQEMLERTRKWLLSRKDGNGGFLRNPRHLHVWSVSQTTVNAYVLWAVSQADVAVDDASRTVSELSAEIDQLYANAQGSNDAYLIALSAITLGNVGRENESAVLMEKLMEMQRENGSLDGVTTITQSGGISKTVETTSLAVLAWSKHAQYRDAARRGARWLIDNRRGNGFGSTQATVLALKALIAMRNHLGNHDGGSVEFLVKDRVVGKVEWQGRPEKGVTWEIPETVQQMLQTETLSMRVAGESEFPYSVQVRGFVAQPESDTSCPIDVQVSFTDQAEKSSVNAGNTIDVIAQISNRTQTGQPMTVASIGLPGGLEPVIESLDRGREQGLFDYYEIHGRDIVLYWRTLAPAQVTEITIPCTAAVPGRYTGPPSRAYLYYTAESKQWRKPLEIEILP